MIVFSFCSDRICSLRTPQTVMCNGVTVLAVRARCCPGIDGCSRHLLAGAHIAADRPLQPRRAAQLGRPRPPRAAALVLERPQRDVMAALAAVLVLGRV